ncbi:MAG: Crp/Fnr family transcriptional regulator [Oscillospiraceae bacterium]|nr:Crp/Fnr family transcriptional regulator [Oscillospiraceae bacterium]
MREICSALPYWALLTDNEKLIIEKNSALRRCSAGELIHSGADDCLGMVMVLSGEIRTFLLSEEGKEVTLFMLREGDACILSSSCILSQITFETQICAAKASELLVVNLEVFQRILSQNTELRLSVYELALERFSQVMWAMQQILFFGFDRRLASFLIEEYERTGDSTVRMTHEQIASRVSSAREVVARMLKQFSSDGLISADRGAVTLTDIDGLKSLL